MPRTQSAVLASLALSRRGGLGSNRQAPPDGGAPDSHAGTGGAGGRTPTSYGEAGGSAGTGSHVGQVHAFDLAAKPVGRIAGCETSFGVQGGQGPKSPCVDVR